MELICSGGICENVPKKKICNLDTELVEPNAGHKDDSVINLTDASLPEETFPFVGEYALFVKDYLGLDVDLTVVPLSGWKREYLLDDTDLPWVAPSPNCPHLETALCYTGMCIFEGANISEGRGTAMPFQLIGAPFIDGALLEKEMNGEKLPGLHFRQVSFCPTFSKYRGELCQGVQMHITDREACDCSLGGLLLMEKIWRMYPDQFSFIKWEGSALHSVDKLLGTDLFRTGKMTARELIDHYDEPRRKFIENARKFRLYE